VTDLVLGIDTGGTYTDGVLLDYHTRDVLKTTKTLTTRHDLTTCILAALDDLLPDDPSRVRLVAISTTLATNAVAEGKGRPVALFLLGYDPDLVRRFRFEGELATRRFFYFDGGHDLNGQPQAPVDVEAVARTAREVAGKVEAFAVSGYFSPFNASHEEAAGGVVERETGRPVVLGHQLASRLNSIQRATTATLNASLLSILQGFIAAMRSALDERGIAAPLMVMCGDGALMDADHARRRPVETVHSGPAASAIGGRVLAGVERALVIDVGGTTTDLAIVDGGRVTVSEDGTTVGPYRTAVRAADVRSIGLGGDSFIGLDVQDRLAVGPERVVPLAYLAHRHQRVACELDALAHRLHERPAPDRIEYWFLQREPERVILDERTRRALDLLRDGPLAVPDILKRLGLLHPLQFGGETLIREEVIGRAALTPTDLLHLTGDFAPWDAEAAKVGARLIARLQGWTVDEFIERTLSHIAERIAAEVVSFITGQSLDRHPPYADYDDLGAWLFEENLYGRNLYLGSRIALKMPIVGIGAPAGIFLPRVADLLHADLILPPHHEVANAVGAVVGGVMVSREAWIFPQMRGMHVVGYYVQAGGQRRRFPRLDEALEHAREALGEQALAEARAGGAVDPSLTFETLPDGAESYRLRARAIGSPRLGGD
jgi:N-methylhydantoinase A/oxoprolinase/acetone carboxylase beta subunit